LVFPLTVETNLVAVKALRHALLNRISKDW
jgi:hypothetical protein